MSEEPPAHAPVKQRRRRGDLAPNPRMWAALRNGAGLREILVDFYTRVYRDERLSRFFHNVTIERAIEKQHAFLMEIFTGERTYFGDRPRNAHHWMVISNDLFDYREELMAECLRRYGLDEELVKQWRAMEEVFRGQIVKSAAVPRKMGGVAMPLEGFATMHIDVGTLCDTCGGEISPGEEITYHVRTGHTRCARCATTSEG